MAIVSVLTLIGFAIRVANFDQGLFGDELSTYWIVHGRSLGEVLDLVHSDAEITPPLFFGLSWLTLKLGSSPEWARLPSLLAGTASIPLVYLLGIRTFGRIAGVFASALMALSPFMIYYSTEARSYALMIFLLLVSTIALLEASESGKRRWWALYAVATCGAMLSHYTAFFYLVGQFGWALWAHPRARKALVIASAVAVAGFMPWLGGFIADNNSPTTGILDALQPFTYHAVRFAIAVWAVGYPYVELRAVPGNAALVLELVGIALAAGAALVALARLGARRHGVRGRRRLKLHREAVLVLILALATPLGEFLASAIGTNLFSARNLNPSWPALAVGAGGVIASAAAAAPLAAGIGAALVLAGFGLGAGRTLESRYARPDYPDAAALINREAHPGDVILDGAGQPTPVPAIGLELYAASRIPEFHLDVPISDQPFTVFDPVPDSRRLGNRAFRQARGHRVFLVSAAREIPLAKISGVNQLGDPYPAKLIRDPPKNFTVGASETFPGLLSLVVTVLDGRRAHRPESR